MTIHTAASSTPIFYAQLAEFDIITQQTAYKDVFQALFTQAVKGFSTTLLYGYAAIRAYTAYNDPTFQSLAEGLWNQAWAYVITDATVSSQKIASKTPGVRDSCNGKSFVGAVFENPTNATDGSIDPRTVGHFLTLSALLAELTKNTTYTQAATQSLQFLKDFMYYPRSNAGNEPWAYGLDNRACDDKTPQPVWYPISGNIIEGLAILTSLTGDGDGSMRNTLSINLNILPRPIIRRSNLIRIYFSLQETIDFSTTFRESQRQDGVIVLSVPISNLPTGDPHLIRALSVACRRNQTLLTDSLANFVNIQYNALLTNATFNGSNMYSGSWIGPPERGLEAINQTYASMVLVHGITLGKTTTGTGTSPTSPQGTNSDDTPTSAGSAPVGSIVGGILGGLALLSIIMAALFFLRRRRQKNRQNGPAGEYIISPFMPGIGSETVETRSNFVSSSDPLAMETHPQSIQAVPAMTKTKIHTKSPPLGTSGPTSGRRPFASTPSSTSGVDSGLTYTDDPHVRFQAMSTAEMARILNARLQTESVHGEMPPAYPQSQLGLP
ncbi:hypothetical protein L218DRAFT_1006709 [Marasmius fiardii PR-910]|nr:hypothetical protein L218DRAFT_1006709 [Marasmius fiardii PR-910]